MKSEANTATEVLSKSQVSDQRIAIVQEAGVAQHERIMMEKVLQVFTIETEQDMKVRLKEMEVDLSRQKKDRNDLYNKARKVALSAAQAHHRQDLLKLERQLAPLEARLPTV